MVATVGHALGRALLAPGDLACGAIGLSKADNYDLVRMLVNSLVWILVGGFAVVLAV